MNAITVTGNVGSKDYIREFTYNKNGEERKGVSFSLAVRDTYHKNPDGTASVQWMKVKAFNAIANSARLLHQGDKVTIRGTAYVEAFPSKKEKDEKGNPKPAGTIVVMAAEIDLPSKATKTDNAKDGDKPNEIVESTVVVDEDELPF